MKIADKKCCYIHRTTQKVLRKSVKSAFEVIRKLVHVILDLYPYDDYSTHQFKLCRNQQPHFVYYTDILSAVWKYLD